MGIASCSVGVEAALHFYKSFMGGKMRFILIASLILFLGIIGTNSAPSREARAAHDYHDHDHDHDCSDSEPEYEPEPEGSGPEPEDSGPEPEDSDPEKEDSDTESDPNDFPKRV